MVTLESGSESIYATDTDADGASTHVLLGSGRADGLVETVQTPQVLGVAVVCEGGGNAAVQNRVTALVETLTGRRREPHHRCKNGIDQIEEEPL